MKFFQHTTKPITAEDAKYYPEVYTICLQAICKDHIIPWDFKEDAAQDVAITIVRHIRKYYKKIKPYLFAYIRSLYIKRRKLLVERYGQPEFDSMDASLDIQIQSYRKPDEPSIGIYFEDAKRIIDNTKFPAYINKATVAEIKKEAKLEYAGKSSKNPSARVLARISILETVGYRCAIEYEFGERPFISTPLDL